MRNSFKQYLSLIRVGSNAYDLEYDCMVIDTDIFTNDTALILKGIIHKFHAVYLTCVVQSHLEKSIFLRSGFFRNEKHPFVAGIAYINADHRLYTKHGVTGEESISSPVTPCFVYRRWSAFM